MVDNCEHVAEAAAQAMQAILDRSATPKVLATSRESLWVAGEQRVLLSPLGLDGGVESEAVALFVERARAVRHGFGIDDTVTADAIELSGLLEHRFALLVARDRRPERQRTLEGVIAWSFDALTDDERRVLFTASVFVGAFDRARLSELIDDIGESV